MSSLLPGFERSPWFGEHVREERLASGIRLIVNAPGQVDPGKPTRLVLYATPNGNSIEQTLGCRMEPGVDWHYDIQHVAAQVRRLRELDTRENVVLACLEADGRSWPAWRSRNSQNAGLIRSLVEELRGPTPGRPVRVELTGHSGGGSFIWGFLNASERVPEYVDRIAFLDANYSYSDGERHGDKLAAWLRADERRQLSVLAYDDRNILLDGKPVVGPTGGTYRASHRMVDRFRREGPIRAARLGEIDTLSGLDGQFLVRIAANPANTILHTVLVGEWNGLLQVLTDRTPEDGKWGRYGPPRAYEKWIQPAALEDLAPATIPPRSTNADGGRALTARLQELSPAEREMAVREELLHGNLPAHLRRFVTIRITALCSDGQEHTIEYRAMPDYLAIGSDRDWVRMPMTPMSAQVVADRFGCALPTRKIVDDVWRAAAVKLSPQPLVHEREAVRTFVHHHFLIEAQRGGQGSASSGVLVAGTKKDVVLTPRLLEKPRRVAIYGWHYPDGKAIQPLTTVHKDTYVDYSHGIRLVSRRVTVDGRRMDLLDVLRDPTLCTLVSDEGPVTAPRYDAPGE